MTAGTAGGPSWTDIMTAIGTVATAIVAVWVALWTDWRSSNRLKAEHERSDRLLMEERARAKAELEDERAYGRAQLEDERRLALEREQLAEAYAVQIVSARASVGEVGQQSDPSDPSMCPMAIIVNHGSYAITKVDARLSDGQTIYRLAKTHHLQAFTRLPEELKGADDEAMPWPEDWGVVSLTPQEPGLRLIGPALRISQSLYVYPLVRWTDRWGARWEHKRGVVQQIRDDEPWIP